MKKIVNNVLAAALMSLMASSYAATDLIVQWNSQLQKVPDKSWLVDGVATEVKLLAPANGRAVKFLKLTVSDDEQVEKVIFQLRKTPAVISVEKDQAVKAQVAPDDTDYNQQFHHDLIKSETAWNTRTDCSSLKIAVLDSGIDLDHSDLVANLWTNPNEIAGNGIDDDNNGYVDDINGYDVNEIDNIPEDGYGHGTHVAGLVAAVANNDNGVAGVCWQAQIIPVRVLNDEGKSQVSHLIAGINYAIAVEADILVMSLTYSDISDAALSALKTAQDNHDALIVVAAGNSGIDIDDGLTFPAGYSNQLTNLIAVSNVEKLDTNTQLTRFSGSNYGLKFVDIAAPGVNIYSTWLDNGYKTDTGTSMSAPIVAGAAALALSEKPELSAKQVRAALLHSVNKVDNDNIKYVTKSGGSLALELLFDNLNNIPTTLFYIDPSDATKLLGLGLSGATKVEFTPFTANNDQVQEVAYVVDSDSQITLGSAATRPGVYTVTTNSFTSNHVATWAQQKPAAPSNVAVASADSSYAISWDDEQTADYYIVERSDDAGVNFNVIADTVSSSPYFDITAPQQDDLQYRVTSAFDIVHPVTTVDDTEQKLTTQLKSDASATVTPSGLAFTGSWLTEKLASFPANYDFINLRLKTSAGEGVSYKVAGGTLPNNLYLSDDFGHIAGDPNEVGNFTFSVSFTSSGDATGTRQFILNINEDNEVRLNEPNGNIPMNFSLSRGQITSLQSKSNTDLATKSMRLSAYNFGEGLGNVIINAQPRAYSGGTIGEIQVRLASGGWQTLDSASVNLALNNGMSWNVFDNSTFDLNEKDNLIEVEYAVTWQTLPTQNSNGDSSNDSDSDSSGGSLVWLLSLVSLIMLRRRFN
ncbi:hypothetical protein C2869_08690 [Saccharobesus litoralis]|uniref:Peptidase S8/S53 domain-containing protein n=1 Tax=Saccharobesus litoralis TaxID=2172099 RepID=A0A2S0VQM7_9ALTE|nr:S8 family serine peptidase [Saccharobesus litoralis]AWB66499.1 hypothetical protein C2869_08690 [Saccharobesus litoralis]